MKRSILLVVLLVLCLFIGWVWWPTLISTTVQLENHHPPTVLRFGHNMPSESGLGMAADKFAQQISTATAGQLQIQVFPKGVLGNDLEMMEMLQNGKLDIALLPSAKMSQAVPALQFADLPFYFASPEQLYRLLDGEPGQFVLAKLHRVGLIGLAFWGNGFKHFTANRPIYTPEDLRGLKVRVMNSPLIIDQFEDLGAFPIPIEFREIRQALIDGRVDAQENPLAAIVAMGIHQVQSNLTLSHHAYLAYVFTLSKKKFAHLTDLQQALLIKTAQDLTGFQRAETTRQEEKFLRQIQSSGVVINRLSDSQRLRFANRLRHTPLQFEEMIGSDILSKAEEVLYEWQSPQEKEREILLGLDADLSSSGEGAGLAVKRGASLAIEEINAAGGVLGKRLVLLSRDNKAMPSRAEENFRFLAARDSVVAILGGIHSSVAISQAELADRLQVPYLVAWAAAAGVVEHVDHPAKFVFRIAANDRLAAPFLVDAALDFGSKVALVLENDHWGRNILPYLQKRLQEKKVEPVLVDWVNRGESNDMLHIQKIHAAGADTVVLVVNPQEGAVWLRDLVSRKPLLPIVAHWAITGGDFFHASEAELNQVNFVFLQTFSWFNQRRSATLAFQNVYRELFDQMPQEVTLPQSGLAQAYDLVHLLARAINQAGTTDRLAIRDALEQIPVHIGLIKKYRFPFQHEKHDALDEKDFFLARFDKFGHIIPLVNKVSP
ncbi:MAG: DctP family TRAP transporter solute-binding subunit [Magnetococcus sp. DMHC-6]